MLDGFVRGRVHAALAGGEWGCGIEVGEACWAMCFESFWSVLTRCCYYCWEMAKPTIVLDQEEHPARSEGTC